MPTAALASFLVALAASTANAPAIVLTPASVAPPAPLAAHCAATSEPGDASDVECVVAQAGPRGAPAPAMRIQIRATPTAPCRVAEAQSVAVPAAATAPHRGPPEVVQPAREAVCGR